MENQDENSKSIIKNALKKTFSPEFLNRIDDVLVFNALEKDHMKKIIHIVAKALLKRVEDMGLHLTITDDAMDFLVEKGFDPQFGARPLQRAIQKYLEDPLAEFILNENPVNGTDISAELSKEKDGIIINSLTANAN
jgi:ATP-dependent Clp protease ATP-binding subunit ClpC